jgi:general secretion pathway protein D
MVTIGGGSDEGQQKNSHSPNQIVVTDFTAVIDEIVLLVEQLDQPQRQISIEVKIIESKVDSKSKLGFAWPTSLTTSLGAGTQTIGEESYQAELENIAGSLNPQTGRWTWGTLTVDQLTTVLDLLNQAGNSKLISDPHITTLENQEAYIKVQTVIPIATISRFSEGAATQDIQTFYDEEVGISLYVTPRINEDSRITLDVRAQIEDIIGFAGPSDNQKPITSSRSLKTTVIVNDSETVALGGLLKETEIEQTQKFPLLGHIPIIGSLLFTNKSTEKTMTDLIILITPRIMP